jgi:tRNA modification GTPase
MRRADLILYVIDASEGDPDPPGRLARDALPPEVPVTLIFNKIDLTAIPAHATQDAEPRIFVSALHGAGMDLVRAHLKARAGFADSASNALAARRRHLDALGRARAPLRSAAEALVRSQTVELFAEDLRLAQRALGEITGEFTPDDLLGAIFGSFCIGK